MATSELAPVGSERQVAEGLSSTVGRSGARRTVGVAGQYLFLVLLAVVVVGPLFFTLIQALSPPFAYVNAGRPWHPVRVDWKDRTWFSGGLWSVYGRTLVAFVAFTWAQKAGGGADLRWNAPKPKGAAGRVGAAVLTIASGLALPAAVTAWKTLGRVRFASVVAGTVALALVTGPVFQSLDRADGDTQLWWLLATVVVAATQVPGFLVDKLRGVPVAILDGLVTALVLVTGMVVAAGAAVWTVAWTNGQLGPAMSRSLLMTVIITTAQVVTSIMAAYAFVFLRFPFKRVLFALFMATLLLPLEVTLVGNIALIRQLEWTDTTQALVLPFAATALGTFLIRQGFRGLPSEIQDATRLDGYGHVAFLTKFAVPLTRPVIASFTVISALQAWNQYLWPRSVIEDPAFNTLQIQLRSIKGESIANANVSIAAALVAALPVVVLLVAFQRQIIRGLTAGAVK
jgi:sn-glycerol 3-phosphate transport system permease protein